MQDIFRHSTTYFFSFNSCQKGKRLLRACLLTTSNVTISALVKQLLSLMNTFCHDREAVSVISLNPCKYIFLNETSLVRCLLTYLPTDLLTPCTCSLVSVKQEKDRVFCNCNKKVTTLQYSSYSIFDRHQTVCARCQYT